MLSVRAVERIRRWGPAKLALPLGLLLAVAIVAPGLTQESGEERKDPGREWALAAGCDLSGSEVPMSVGEFDYAAGAGSKTLEEAVLESSSVLSSEGASYSEQTLRDAVAAADTSTNPIEVRLKGAALTVERTSDGLYQVTQLVMCA
jgi:hypothetical protein